MVEGMTLKQAIIPKMCGICKCLNF